MTDEGFYDDVGRWWPANAEWCDRCQGMGTEDCDCGGDFCVCGAYDSLPCRRCHGEGYWVPTPAQLAAREAQAKWWRELHSARRDSDEQPKAENAERLSPEGVPARAAEGGIAQPPSPPQPPSSGAHK